MSKYLISDSILTDIADSIREKTGSQETLSPASFSNEIDGISGGADLNDYFVTEITSDTTSSNGIPLIKKLPTIHIANGVTSLMHLGNSIRVDAPGGTLKLTGGKDVKVLFSISNGIRPGKIDFSEFEARQLTCCSFMTEYANSVTEVDFGNVTIAPGCEIQYMFRDAPNMTKIDIRCFEFVNITLGEYMFGEDSKRVPANCLVIVKDNTAKDWVLTNFDWLTNVKTVAEYEAE